LNQPAQIISNYQIEPQGEAICFDSQNTGFYTTSEQSPLKIPSHLYYYSKKNSSVENETVARIDSLFPNPASGIVKIRLFFTKPSEGTIDIIDVRGNKTRLASEKTFGEGSNEILFDTKVLSSGIYRIRLQSKESESNFKFIVKH
jgi:hypothetical protein